MTATDYRVQVGYWTHPKTQKLVRRAGPGADGQFLRLWSFCAATAGREDGDLSGMDDEDIEIAAGWFGETGALVAALEEVGYLDGSDGERRIHEWTDHQPWAGNSGARSKAGAANSLARWHRRGKHDGAPRAGCPLCEEAASHGVGSAVASNGTGSACDTRNRHSSDPDPDPDPGSDSDPGSEPGGAGGLTAPAPAAPESAQLRLEPTEPDKPDKLEPYDPTDIKAGKYDHLKPKAASGDQRLLRGLCLAHKLAWDSPSIRNPNSKDGKNLKLLLRGTKDEDPRKPSDVATAIIGMRRDPPKADFDRREHNGWAHLRRHFDKWLEMGRPKGPRPPSPDDRQNQALLAGRFDG